MLQGHRPRSLVRELSVFNRLMVEMPGDVPPFWLRVPPACFRENYLGIALSSVCLTLSDMYYGVF